MKTENSNSEKDLNANPKSKHNTNKPVAKPGRFPKSKLTKDEMEKMEKQEKDSDIELLADDVDGTVGARQTGSSPGDMAGVSDLDRGMRRAKRK